MNIEIFDAGKHKSVVELFTSVFGHSEGEAEGRLIANLVAELIDTTASEQLIGFVAVNDNQIIGSIFFSAFSVVNEQLAFILSPVAIATSEQGKGVGQTLINFGIEHLKSQSVDIVLTYGDPKYYSKVGFKQISEDVIAAPLKLSFPEGWLAQSLKGQDITPIAGPTQCVAALNDQQYW